MMRHISWPTDVTRSVVPAACSLAVSSFLFLLLVSSDHDLTSATYANGEQPDMGENPKQKKLFTESQKLGYCVLRIRKRGEEG